MLQTEAAAIETFIERMGLSAQSDGLPRIAGRMIGFFVIHGGPFSFGEIADKLQISRGSVSTNARILRALGVIERVSRPGDRQDYYQLATKPYARMLAGYVQRMQHNLWNVEEASQNVAQENEGMQSRLGEMEHFYKTAIENTQAIITKL